MHPQEMNINDQRKTVPNKDVKYGLSGAELQQFEEYPQRPSEPECQHFMKTRYCKFKSACRYHHPKSNVSFFGLPEGLASDNYQVGFIIQLLLLSLKILFKIIKMVHLLSIVVL